MCQDEWQLFRPVGCGWHVQGKAFRERTATEGERSYTVLLEAEAGPHLMQGPSWVGRSQPGSSTATWVKIPVRMYWWGSVQGWWAQWNRAVVRALFEVDLTDLLTGFGWQIMRRRSRKVSKIAAFKFLWDGQRCRARFTGKARGSQSLQGSRWLSRSIAGEAWTS